MKRLKPLIGICGPAGSGKDTLADGIAATDVYVKHNLADPIKAALNAMFGWGPAHWENRDWKEEPVPWLERELAAEGHESEMCNPSPRYLAQTLGTEWGRERIDPEIWLKIAQRKYAKIAGAGTMSGGRIVGMGMIIPDIRFENEAAWIKDEGGLLFEVQRPGHEAISESEHASERGVPIKYIDAVIINDGPPSKMISEARRVLWDSSGFSAVSASS